VLSRFFFAPDLPLVGPSRRTFFLPVRSSRRPRWASPCPQSHPGSAVV
jgi:hypothetical protein